MSQTSSNCVPNALYVSLMTQSNEGRGCWFCWNLKYNAIINILFYLHGFQRIVVYNFMILISRCDVHVRNKPVVWYDPRLLVGALGRSPPDGNIWGGSEVNFPHRTPNKFSKFFAEFPHTDREYCLFQLKILVIRGCWRTFRKFYQKMNEKKSKFRLFQ